jgi:hypothetical protein
MVAFVSSALSATADRPEDHVNKLEKDCKPERGVDAIMEEKDEPKLRE